MKWLLRAGLQHHSVDSFISHYLLSLITVSFLHMPPLCKSYHTYTLELDGSTSQVLGFKSQWLLAFSSTFVLHNIFNETYCLHLQLMFAHWWHWILQWHHYRWQLPPESSTGWRGSVSQGWPYPQHLLSLLLSHQQYHYWRVECSKPHSYYCVVGIINVNITITFSAADSMCSRHQRAPKQAVTPEQQDKRLKCNWFCHMRGMCSRQCSWQHVQ